MLSLFIISFVHCYFPQVHVEIRLFAGEARYNKTKKGTTRTTRESMEIYIPFNILYDENQMYFNIFFKAFAALFVNCQNFAGSWGRYFVCNCFEALQCFTLLL